MNGLKSKKGDVIFDILFIVIILVVLGVSAMLIYPTLTEIKSDILSNPSSTPDVAQSLANTTDKYPASMDNSIGFALVLLTIFVMISAWFIDTNPIFFIVSLILIICVLIAVFFISNALFDVISEDDFATSINSFPITYWTITHLAHIVLGLFVFVGVIIYAKTNT